MNNSMSTREPAPTNLQRVAVVGTSCSGKTTFAGQLSKKLGVPHIELDALHWLPDWQERSVPEFRNLVKQETAKERWVSDGNYSKVQDIVMGRATDVVWLNYPFPLVFWRGLKRSVVRSFTREELFSGNRESIRITFFSRDSILLWIIKSYKRNIARYRAYQQSPEWQHLRFWEFHSPQETSYFLNQLSN
jgi:adenylate kinase family enzyme